MSDSIRLQQDPEGLVLRYLKKPTPDGKDLIMVQYAGLVERIARRFSGLEPFEDLCQVGFIGLLNALGKFDPEAGVRFNTYATYLVAGEIKHYLRDRTQTIRHPAWLQELRHKVNRSIGMLQQTHGRPPTEREIADAVGVSETAVREVFLTQEMLRVGSLDAPPPGEDDGAGEAENLDAAAFCPEQLSVEDRLMLENAMKQLRELEREVLMHFHFDTMNQTEIAQKLGISCNYVSHILRQSLTKLRKILAGEEEKDRVLRRQTSTIDYDVMDADTGAYTETYFHTRLQEEVHRASAGSSAVGLVCVNFKGLDTLRSFYGEASVSDFMADAAEFLRDHVRRIDIVAKIGESGYGVILPVSGPDIERVRERLVNNIAHWMGGRLSQNGPIEVELGQAQYPADAKTAKTLLKKAALKPLEDMGQAA